jgi:hypothetical protein
LTLHGPTDFCSRATLGGVTRPAGRPARGATPPLPPRPSARHNNGDAAAACGAADAVVLGSCGARAPPLTVTRPPSCQGQRDTILSVLLLPAAVDGPTAVTTSPPLLLSTCPTVSLMRWMTDGGCTRARRAPMSYRMTGDGGCAVGKVPCMVCADPMGGQHSGTRCGCDGRRHCTHTSCCARSGTTSSPRRRRLNKPPKVSRSCSAQRSPRSAAQSRGEQRQRRGLRRSMRPRLRGHCQQAGAYTRPLLSST